MKSFLPAILGAALIAGCAAPALAQGQYPDQQTAQERNTQAYSAGFSQGQADARNRLARNDQAGAQWTTSSDQQAYRQGYDAGYNHIANEVTAAPGANTAPGDNQASQFGYQDGLAAGRQDALKGTQFKPASHDLYKNAAHGWTPALGTKAEFAQLYREAFMKGYEAGFRGTGTR